MEYFSVMLTFTSEWPPVWVGDIIIIIL
jgi:hypothetical protein